MAGERSLSSIKNFLQEGGKKNEEITFEKFVNWEETRTKTTYIINNSKLLLDKLYDDHNFSIYVENNFVNITYCDYYFILNYPIDIVKEIQKKKCFSLVNNFYENDFTKNNNVDIENAIGIENIEHNESIFNIHDINDLLISLKDECVKICETFNNKEEDPLLHSSICRLFSCYQNDKNFLNIKINKIKKDKNADVTFYGWIWYVGKLKYPINITAKNEIDICDYHTMDEILNLHKTLMDNIYLNALIYGQKFKSRGIDFKENRDYNSMDGLHSNIFNDLDLNWHHGNSLSSWFKCGINRASKNNIIDEFYGQFNFFFTIPTFKYDKMVSGMHYSSVVLRNFHKDQFNIDYVQLRFENSFVSKFFFIHNINVYATTFIVSAVNVGDEPIGKNEMHNSSIPFVSRLKFLPFSPANMKIKFSENALFINDENNMRPIMFQEKQKKYN
jgi:hypothetical protein